MARNSVYFPNLNGVRFIAALAVIIHHIELTKYWFGQPNIYTTSFVGGVFGQLGIILFFVLSGFLITYLLLEENKQKQHISIKQFYIRRMLRIWPLYYLIVVLGLFILPKIHFFDIPNITTHVKEHFATKSAMFLSFFPNVAYAMYEPVPYSEQAWSVGVEEQFYLLWPVLIALVIKRFRTMRMLLSTIGIYLFIKIAVVFAYSLHPENLAIDRLYQFWTHFSIDCMAIGGIGAYILFYEKEKILKLLFNKYLQIVPYIALVYITVRGIAVPIFNSEFYAVIFIVLILNLAANKKTLLRLNYKPLDYLGRISFGLYMFHNIILVMVLRLMLSINKNIYNSLEGNIVYYILSILFTIIIAGLSYRFFEKPFIKAKVKYSSVISGENAVDSNENTDVAAIDTKS
ncbi:MAG: acyltransferase [Flavipsychrobacter sp.]